MIIITIYIDDDDININDEDNLSKGIKRTKSKSDDDDDSDDSDDDNDLSTIGGKSTKSKDTKEKSKEQREKRKQYCDKLISQAKLLSESALIEADKKEEVFNDLKTKKLLYFNTIINVLNHLCIKDFDKSISRNTWNDILQDNFEIIFPRNGYLLFKEEIRVRRSKVSNDSLNNSGYNDTNNTSDDRTRVKITDINDIIRAISCINYFFVSLARLDSNLLNRITFQPRLKEFLLNGQTVSAKVLYTSTNAFLCGGSKEITIQGNILVKFANNDKISSIELFYNKHEFDLVFAESFGSALSKMSFIDYHIQEGTNDADIFTRFALSDLETTSHSFTLDHRSKVSMEAFKEVEECDILNKQKLTTICNRNVDETFTQSKPECFYIEPNSDVLPQSNVALLIQAMPYYFDNKNIDKVSNKFSMPRVFEFLLDKIPLAPNKIIWMVHKCNSYDNVLTGLIYTCVKTIVSTYSSWLNSIKDFITNGFKSTVTSRYNSLQEIFQVLRKILSTLEANIGGDSTVNIYDVLQEFLQLISRIDGIINAEVREDEYMVDSLNDVFKENAEVEQLIDMLVSEEQQFIRSISHEVDKFFTQIRGTPLLEQVVRLLKSTNKEIEANSIQHFINLCWNKHSNPAIQGLQESLRSYMLQKSNHETAICISEIIAIDPFYAEAFCKRATINHNVQDINAAFSDIETAISIDPYHFGAWCTKGIMEMKLSSYDAAIRSFTKAIEINPWLQSKPVKGYLDNCLKLRQQDTNENYTV